VSRKVTIREVDGTEYQLKAKLGKMVVGAGFAENRERGLIVMVAVSLAYALRIMVVTENCERGRLKPEGRPECSLAAYPAPDQMTRPHRFGAKQDWSRFPIEVA
jgi:hypothetical protein